MKTHSFPQLLTTLFAISVLSACTKDQIMPPPDDDINFLTEVTAIAGNDQTITLPSNSATLDASASSAGGGIASFLWQKISGPALFEMSDPASSINEVTNLVQGTYEFELTVANTQGTIDKDTIAILVMSSEPVAIAGPDVTAFRHAVILNGDQSYDANGSITVHSWKQISGPPDCDIKNEFSAITEVANLQEGVYVFELTVTDNNGSKASDRVTITILPNPGEIIFNNLNWSYSGTVLSLEVVDSNFDPSNAMQVFLQFANDDTWIEIPLDNYDYKTSYGVLSIYLIEYTTQYLGPTNVKVIFQ